MIQTSVSIHKIIVRNLSHVAQGLITTIEDVMLSFANNCATNI